MHHHLGCCFYPCQPFVVFTLFAICTLVVSVPVVEDQPLDPVLALMQQSSDQGAAQHFLRLCPDDTECEFFGSMFDKPLEEKATSQDEAKGEQSSSFFMFKIKSNTVDVAQKINQYEMKMTMFMYADTKTVNELNTRVDAWDAAQSTASQLHQTLLKHAGDNAQESADMTANPIYFKTSKQGKILNFCCGSGDTKKVCEYKRMVIKQALEEIHPAVQTAMEDLEVESTADIHGFDSGTAHTRHKVTILDRATHTKRIHIRKQASRHIVMDTEWETAPIEADTEDLELNAQPIPPTADLGPIEPRSPASKAPFSKDEQGSAGCTGTLKVMKVLNGGSGPSKKYWLGRTNPTVYEQLRLNFTSCSCSSAKALTIEFSTDGKQFNMFQYAGGFTGPKSKNVYGTLNATHIRINGTFAMGTVEALGGCQQLPAGTTSPAFKGSRLKANAKGSYENPHLKVEGQQEVAVDTEGANHDIKEMKGQQTADVDARDKQQRNADPKNQQGRVGTQTTGSLFSLKRLASKSIAKLDASHNLNANPNACQAGYNLLQVVHPTGHVDDVDETTPISFDMKKFKEKMLRQHHSGKTQGAYGHHLGPEYGSLRRNLAHIRSLDTTFRGWLEDGSLAPEAGRKWHALLGGTNHDLAEEILVAYVDDDTQPEVLRESALVNLLTPRRRMHSTIEKLWQLAAKEHVHQDLCHTICGGLLKRYASVEGTQHVPARIQQIYNELHRKVTEFDETKSSSKRLAAAIGALGNTHFKRAIPTLVSHMNHPKARVRASARTALNLVKKVHPKIVNDSLLAAVRTVAKIQSVTPNSTVTNIQESADPDNQANHINPESSPTRFGGFDSINDRDNKKTASGRDIGNGAPDAIEGDDCNGMGFDGSLFCLETRKYLTQSDHHTISVSAGLGLGIVADANDASNTFEDILSQQADKLTWEANSQSDDALKESNWVLKGGGSFDLTLGDSDPKRMLGLDAGVVFEKDGTLSVLCTVTLLGYQIDAPWCWMSKSKEEQQLDELEISQEATGDLEALDKFDFQSGVTVTREFSETTFLHVQVRFWIWFIPCAIDLAVAGSTWGRLGIKTNLQGGFSVLGGVKPGATATLTLEVSIDIFIARLGVGGELNIVEAGLPAVATLKPSNTGNTFGMTLGGSLELLGGRVYAFIELGFWIFCCIRAELTIAEWDPLITVEFDLFTLPLATAFGPVKTPPPLPAPPAWCKVKLARKGTCSSVPDRVWFFDFDHGGPKNTISPSDCRNRGWAKHCGLQDSEVEYKSVDLGCPTGYSKKNGDLPGWGDANAGGKLENVASIAACAALCANNDLCQSFEYLIATKVCNRNNKGMPTASGYPDQLFCAKECPAGFYREAGAAVPGGAKGCSTKTDKHNDCQRTLREHQNNGRANSDTCQDTWHVANCARTCCQATWGDATAGGSTMDVQSVTACSELCNSNVRCKSFEWVKNSKWCHKYNSVQGPSKGGEGGQGAFFCAVSCPGGYTWKQGDLPGAGNVESGGQLNNTESMFACAQQCDANAECLSIEYSPSQKKCNRHNKAGVCSGAVDKFITSWANPSESCRQWSYKTDSWAALHNGRTLADACEAPMGDGKDPTLGRGKDSCAKTCCEATRKPNEDYTFCSAAWKLYTCEQDKHYKGGCKDATKNCPAQDVTLNECEALCEKTTGCNAIAHNPGSEVISAKYELLFNGCPRGSEVRGSSSKGRQTLSQCKALCDAESNCNAIEINGCSGNGAECGGDCYLFYFRNTASITNGKCVTNGDQRGYKKSSSGSVARILQYEFLGHGCPRDKNGNTGASQGKGRQTLARCQALCDASAGCTAIEVNGCHGDSVNCGGDCYLFSFNAAEEIRVGKCVTNGDQRAYKKSSVQHAQCFIKGTKGSVVSLTGTTSCTNTGGLKNAGAHCYHNCGDKQGWCPWCGNGLCCRKNWASSNGCNGKIGGHEQHVCVGRSACNAAVSTVPTDGATDTYAGWYDAQDCGRCSDYCRWVGAAGSGGDPYLMTTKYKFLFDGCPRGPAATSSSHKGWQTQVNCQKMCDQDSNCNGIEISGCSGSSPTTPKASCGGECYLFYGSGTTFTNGRDHDTGCDNKGWDSKGWCKIKVSACRDKSVPLNQWFWDKDKGGPNNIIRKWDCQVERGWKNHCGISDSQFQFELVDLDKKGFAKTGSSYWSCSSAGASSLKGQYGEGAKLFEPKKCSSRGATSRTPILDGCYKITNKKECCSSYDGRNHDNDLRDYGRTDCVWLSGSGNKCEPQKWVTANNKQHLVQSC